MLHISATPNLVIKIPSPNYSNAAHFILSWYNYVFIKIKISFHMQKQLAYFYTKTVAACTLAMVLAD